MKNSVGITSIRNGRIAATAMAIALLSIAGQVSAATVLDQSNVPTNHVGGLEITNQTVAQTFTVGIGGTLPRIDIVGISHHRCVATDDLVVSLVSAAGGIPTATVLARVALPPASVPILRGTVTVDISSFSVSVSVGEVLAIVLSSNAPPGGCTYAWDGDQPGAYAGGRSLITFNLADWSEVPFDMGFQTFVKVAGRRIDLSDYCNGADDLDDTACIREWIEAGRSSPTAVLSAPAGTYLFRQAMPLYSGLRLQCAGATETIFRNNGGSGLFLAAAAAVHGVRIENCGFDVKGSTANFLAVISVNPSDPTPSTKLLVRGNRFYDSAIPGQMSAQQRQYILLLNCEDCRVEENHLSEGGRIKLGRPGRGLLIRGNTVEHANDNAITVVDIGDGLSEDIRIVNNRVLHPLVVGIFFGADGEGQTSPSLITRNVRIEGNQVEGDWRLACILGTLPAIADGIVVKGNTCVKQGPTLQGTAGIIVKRTNNAALRATDIRVEANMVVSSAPPQSGPALDFGGIFFSGSHAEVRVVRNQIVNVGPRAMLFRNVDIVDARIVRNALVGGVIVIEGSVQGVVQDP